MITRMRRAEWMFHNEGNNGHIRAWQRVRQEEQQLLQPSQRLTESILKVRGSESGRQIAIKTPATVWDLLA